MILYKFVNYKGSAMNGGVTEGSKEGFLSVSSCVRRGTKVAISRVFRGCNRRGFHSVRRSTYVRLTKLRNLMVTSNNNTFAFGEGIRTFGNGSGVIFLSIPLKVVGDHLGGSAAEPLLRHPSESEIVGSLCSDECPVCRTTTSVIMGNGGAPLGATFTVVSTMDKASITRGPRGGT